MFDWQLTEPIESEPSLTGLRRHVLVYIWESANVVTSQGVGPSLWSLVWILFNRTRRGEEAAK